MMFDFASLAPSDLAMLMTLDVILRAEVYFNDDATLVASRILANTATAFKSATTAKQARYATTLTHALDGDTYTPMLRKACVIVSKWPLPSVAAGPELDDWRLAMSRLFQAIGRADEDTRAEVWWTLIDDVGALTIAESPAVRKIIHLLTPIPGRLGIEQIRAMVPDEYLQEWREQTVHATGTAQVLVRESLANLDTNQAECSRKRKRDSDKEEEVIRHVRKEIPDLHIIEVKDVLPALLAHVER